MRTVIGGCGHGAAPAVAHEFSTPSSPQAQNPDEWQRPNLLLSVVGIGGSTANHLTPASPPMDAGLPDPGLPHGQDRATRPGASLFPLNAPGRTPHPPPPSADSAQR